MWTGGSRPASRVYLRVAGPIQPGLAVEDVKLAYGGGLWSGDLTVHYRLRNTGNIRVQGDSRLSVTGLLGTRLGETSKVELPELLPGASVDRTAEVSSVLPLGRLDATVIVNPTSSEGLLPTASRSGSLFVAP